MKRKTHTHTILISHLKRAMCPGKKNSVPKAFAIGRCEMLVRTKMMWKPSCNQKNHTLTHKYTENICSVRFGSVRVVVFRFHSGSIISAAVYFSHLVMSWYNRKCCSVRDGSFCWFPRDSMRYAIEYDGVYNVLKRERVSAQTPVFYSFLHTFSFNSRLYPVSNKFRIK